MIIGLYDLKSKTSAVVIDYLQANEGPNFPELLQIIPLLINNVNSILIYI